MVIAKTPKPCIFRRKSCPDCPVFTFLIFLQLLKSVQILCRITDGQHYLISKGGSPKDHIDL